MSTTPDAPASRQLAIHHLRLQNFRCFAALEVAFHPRLTVLVANNGQGKTALLDAVAVALGPFVSAFDEGKDRPFRADDIRLVGGGSPLFMESSPAGVRLEATGLVQSVQQTWARQLTGPKSRTTRQEAQALIEYGKRLQLEVRLEAQQRHEAQQRGEKPHAWGIRLPVVAYYPTDRLWNVRRMPYRKLARTSRMVGYTHALESGSDYRLMADWIRYWTFNRLAQRNPEGGFRIAEMGDHDYALDVVRGAVDQCLAQTGWSNFGFSTSREELVARHPQQGELPLSMLSDGVRSMLTLVADLAVRAYQLNPNLGPLAALESEGIVLIDEVDMHLHPAWQQTVLASLLAAFPKLQFIVSTHSPQVLSTVPAECVRVLGDGAVRQIHQQTRGMPSSDILAAVMGVDPTPAIGPTKQLSQYKALIEQGQVDSDQGVALRAELVAHFGAVHPAMLECDRLIRLQSFRESLRSKAATSGAG